MRVSLIGLVVGLVLGMIAPAASAQPVDPETKARADAAFAEGTAAFDASDFVRAALDFEEAYGLVPDAAYLFNIGQAYRFGKECVKATAAYQKFIELVPDAPNVDKAKLHLQEVKVCALFVEGRRLMGAGKPAEACTQFAAAHAEDPKATGTMLNLGLCNEQIGKVATAATWFRKAQNSAARVRRPSPKPRHVRGPRRSRRRSRCSRSW
ncbi:MAG: tetratricopeptide repeat protein [Deltaproteobacteria bacterium]|nr:tetratricopeptide repeat protein [Deltaproteobacteria bacterium]MDQ3297200.1 tetratricopeptide repeat protein [Myxococcota bacterium]